MEIKIKKLVKEAVIPQYAKPGDAGMDLVAIDYEHDINADCHVYHTGIAIEIPEGYVGLIFPRSSNRKTESYMCNHVGIIDSGYRGEILVSFKNRDIIPAYIPYYRPYDIQDKIAQLMIIPYPKVEFKEVDELSKTERGTGGHGSTGR